MKTYTDAGQLPLREVMESLPGFGKGDDSRSLVPDGPAVSSQVPENGLTDAQENPVNIGENHYQSLAVTAGLKKSEWRREGDSNPISPFNGSE
jgi:hypothetical protein